MTDLQRAFYHQLRKEWGQRWWYTARRAFDLARSSEPFAVSRLAFYRSVRLG